MNHPNCQDDSSGIHEVHYRAPKLISYGSVRELTRGANGSGADAGPGASPTNMKTPTSDPCLKENVVRIGEHPAGFGIYLFDYKPEFRDSMAHGRQFGVMADEVEKIVPEAVWKNADGYRCVDYDRLNIVRH